MDRLDTTALKREHPVAEVLAGYGVGLRPCGTSLVGRCPFHPDRGRPNLYVYPASGRWHCYRCDTGGDAIDFVERIEGIGFREAVEQMARVPSSSRVARRREPSRRGPGKSALARAEQACLTAAVALYHRQLLDTPLALGYVRRRGLDPQTLDRCRVGYAPGDTLVAWLQEQGLSSRAAVDVGLLHPRGGEFLAGRVVVPELRGGQPVWLIGRRLPGDASEPRYLSLPGPKPLLGWESARPEPAVFLTEGVFDWLTLRSWSLPALALCGTHASPTTVQALARFERVYLALDSDAAGQAAAERLQQALGHRAVPVCLPGVKDVADLAPRPDGRTAFLEAVRQAEREQEDHSNR